MFEKYNEIKIIPQRKLKNPLSNPEPKSEGYTV
jgi:hypothetical protein